MPLTDWERKVLKRIRDWENKLLDYEPNDFRLTYEKFLEQSFGMLPEKIQKKFFSVVDSWLFHFHSIIQGSQMQLEARERILSAGRIFNNNVEKIADLKTLKLDQLQYIAEQQMARHRFYSFVQGGLTGTGSTIFVGTDIPTMAIINLRVVQLIAMTYGFEINTPYEMMTSLKVFHTATLPPRFQKEGWNTLMDELEGYDRYFYNGEEDITDFAWVEPLVQQLVKAMVIIMFRKRIIQGIPFVSVAIGAGANVRFTKNVTEFAHKYYQLRFLKNKEVGNDEY
ncbi:EcsC family protein [Neobacillus sp. PS3-40]|uniref:EcsC family protein n=1 Tax=Neobacillus sp. PS3-40 TaxID=3070679 RepID=UPI0027DF4306|nr:EcsC family protein [Neobacillus sp. PS3-40]WML45657.1 EcsC family protein [Neobacillus sp. PS3-40]